jgi:hypothetical protein
MEDIMDINATIAGIFGDAEGILGDAIGDFKSFLEDSPFADILGDMFDPLFSGDFDIF